MELELLLVISVIVSCVGITLFLYGIGAITLCHLYTPGVVYYIIPIWNWSFQALILNHSHNFYYIIPIWNWSRYLYLVRMRLLIITLFLYGIGAVLLSSHFQLHLITLFLYGIGANRICKRRT